MLLIEAWRGRSQPAEEKELKPDRVAVGRVAGGLILSVLVIGALGSVLGLPAALVMIFPDLAPLSLESLVESALWLWLCITLGLTVTQRHRLAGWIHRPAAGRRIRGQLDAAAPLVRWLRERVGPTEKPRERR